tara:strand:- start:1187 stop:1408 length:222 start_codon:yes stop_codon:yes gene_type:complete
MYIVKLVPSSDFTVQHTVLGILWDEHSKDAKIECIRSLKRWHEVQFPRWRLSRMSLDDEDALAWRMALEETNT